MPWDCQLRWVRRKVQQPTDALGEHGSWSQTSEAQKAMEEERRAARERREAKAAAAAAEKAAKEGGDRDGRRWQGRSVWRRNGISGGHTEGSAA